ncbi:hypothetical protein AMV241 [Betaentomopoxvirus amoorei]|uniref:AMV241 n=1 Tax=Amsacta moorei entomopoxvirus TaxID=28321 RepID=Q9EMG5_AMEPV|nr:hypothetical protein AMV241 [Amsacta moorei entomopoxvirus]AAG02947.1 AMV241 [Amsacta moorei entomopoxvirus]
MEKELIENIYTIIKFLPDESYNKLTIKSITDFLYKSVRMTEQTLLKLLSEKTELNPLLCKEFESQLDKIINT